MNKKASIILLLIICMLTCLGKIQAVNKSACIKKATSYNNYLKIPAKDDGKTRGTLTPVNIPKADGIRVEGNLNLSINKNHSSYLYKSLSQDSFIKLFKYSLITKSLLFETSCHQKTPLYLINQVFRI